MPTFVRLCPETEVAEGQVILREADGTKLAVCRHQGKVYALSNFCPHLTGNLGEGTIDEGVLVCPEHGWRFRLSSGRCVNVPDRSAHTFPVRVEEGWVLVGL
jgi:nitrite reductase/ring-hydroxylating ferredoxin subunit